MDGSAGDSDGSPANPASGARRRRFRLLLKTHEEITSFEIMRLVDAVGSEVLGVAFDPVNLFIRFEHPVAAAERLAHLVGQLHIDDASLSLGGSVLRRHLCRPGDGLLDWPLLLRRFHAVPRFVDVHRAAFAMEAFDARLLADQPDLSASEYASVLALAAKGRAADERENFDVGQLLVGKFDFPNRV